MDTKEIEQKQQEYDQQYWQHNGSELEKIRHITLHLGKLLGKLSAYCEQQEHAIKFPTTTIKTDVIPDLIFYAAQLGNLLEVDLGQAYENRLENNKKKLNYPRREKEE